MYICTTYHFKGKAENEQPGEPSTLSCLYSYLKSTRLGSEQTQDIKVIMFFHFLFLLKIKTFIIWITYSKIIQHGLERGILGSRIPAPFQLESLIPKFCHRYAEYRIRARILANPASPGAVKSRIPLEFSASRTDTGNTPPDPHPKTLQFSRHKMTGWTSLHGHWLSAITTDGSPWFKRIWYSKEVPEINPII